MYGNFLRNNNYFIGWLNETVRRPYFSWHSREIVFFFVLCYGRYSLANSKNTNHSNRSRTVPSRTFYKIVLIVLHAPKTTNLFRWSYGVRIFFPFFLLLENRDRTEWSAVRISGRTIVVWWGLREPQATGRGRDYGSPWPLKRFPHF